MFKKLLFLTCALFLLSNVLATNIHENSYIVIDLKTNTTIIEKDAYKKVYPASTTKILTCIIALENLNLEDTVTVTKDMLDELPQGSSTMKLVVGDTLTIKDIIYGLMVPSGNDAAIVLAHVISGSSEEFETLMNEKLKEIGCTNTHFTNPHGFHEDNHYTIASDMAKIFAYALKNETFLEILKTKNYSIAPNNQVGYTRNYTSTNYLLNNSKYEIYGKTGYTDEAGNVFVSYCKSGDSELIAVLLDGDKNYYNNKYRFEDTLAIYDYIFENYSTQNIIKENTIRLQYIDKKNYYSSIFSNEDFDALIKNNEKIIIDYDYYAKSNNLENLNISFKSKDFYSNNSVLTLKEFEKEKLNLPIITEKLVKLILLSFIDLILIVTALLQFVLIRKAMYLKKRKKLNKRYY